jgi:hypothetical protein
VLEVLFTCFWIIKSLGTYHVSFQILLFLALEAREVFQNASSRILDVFVGNHDSLFELQGKLDYYIQGQVAECVFRLHDIPA